jgi:hypothetical protein
MTCRDLVSPANKNERLPTFMLIADLVINGSANGRPWLVDFNSFETVKVRAQVEAINNRGRDLCRARLLPVSSSHNQSPVLGFADERSSPGVLLQNNYKGGEACY